MAKSTKKLVRVLCERCWARNWKHEPGCSACTDYEANDRYVGTVTHGGQDYKFVTWLVQADDDLKERAMVVRDVTGKVVWDEQEPAPIARMVSWFLDYMDSK